MTADPRTGLDWMTREESLELVAADVIGRVAVISGGTPLVFPVNYVLDGDAVVFRTTAGTKLTASARSRASFEVDHVDRATRTGWSVLLVGRLEEVTRYDGPRWRHVHELPVEPWAPGDKRHLMRLVPDRITGRRITAR